MHTMTPTPLDASAVRQLDVRKPDHHWAGYCWAAGAVAAATILFSLLNREFNLSQNVDLLYLPIVLLCAYRFGMGPAALAAGASVLCWDFFFITPLYSLHIGSTRDVLMLIVFLVVSAITGN